MGQLGLVQTPVLKRFKMDIAAIELYTVGSFYSVIPTIIGLFFIRNFNTGVKVLVANQFLNNILMLFSNVNFFEQPINTHYFYYLSILITSTCYSLFFAKILGGKKILFLSFAILINSFVAFDYFKNGLKEMNILPFIFIDTFVILACIYFWKIKKSVSKPLNFLLKVFVIYSVYDGIMSFATSYFYDFLNDKIFNLIWFYINPIVGIVFYSALSYCFYWFGITKKPNFESIGDFK